MNAEQTPLAALLARDFSKEYSFIASRSGGAGGQNVNKVSSKIELRFHVDSSQLLTEEEKAQIKEKLANQINQDGILQIVSQEERGQLGNKEICVKKFYQLLKKAFTKPKPRKATKPSKASVQARLNDKKKESEKKNTRSEGKNALKTSTKRNFEEE